MFPLWHQIVRAYIGYEADVPTERKKRVIINPLSMRCSDGTKIVIT